MVPLRGMISGDSLARLRANLRARLDVEGSLTRGGCIACSPRLPANTQLWYSPEGESEYRRSGCCEYCFDAIVGGDACGTLCALTDSGREIVMLWFHTLIAQKALSLPNANMPQLRKWTRRAAHIPWPWTNRGTASPMWFTGWRGFHVTGVLPHKASPDDKVLSLLSERPVARPALICICARRSDAVLRAAYVVWSRCHDAQSMRRILPDCTWCGCNTSSMCPKCEWPLCPMCAEWIHEEVDLVGCRRCHGG